MVAGVDSWLPHTMERLYKGHLTVEVGVGRWLPYTVEPLYKGRLTDGWCRQVVALYRGTSLQRTPSLLPADIDRWFPCAVEPLYKGHPVNSPSVNLYINFKSQQILSIACTLQKMKLDLIASLKVKDNILDHLT